jgi:hypothetical protein
VLRARASQLASNPELKGVDMRALLVESHREMHMSGWLTPDGEEMMRIGDFIEGYLFRKAREGEQVNGGKLDRCSQKGSVRVFDRDRDPSQSHHGQSLSKGKEPVNKEISAQLKRSPTEHSEPCLADNDEYIVGADENDEAVIDNAALVMQTAGIGKKGDPMHCSTDVQWKDGDDATHRATPLLKRPNEWTDVSL